MSKLEAKGRDILRKQYYDRSKVAREAVKLENGRHAVYNTISSKNSLRQHESQWRQFATYASEKYNVKGLRKLDKGMVASYLNELKAQGVAEKTLKSRVSAINHVMVGSGVWKSNQKVSLTDLRAKGAVSHEKGARRVYKPLTGKEWREANKEAYRANMELVDLSRAFGLRRSEIFGKAGSSYKGLTFRNLGHVEGSKRLFAEVIGKGGKYRVVPVSEAFKGQMWAKYGAQSRTYPKNYFQKPVEERARLLKSSLKSKERLFQTNKSNVPLHINRNEYVERMLKERQKHYEKSQGKITPNQKRIGYSRIRFRELENGRLELFKVDYKNGQRVITAVKPFDVIKVATFEGYALAAADVMRAVGHNRLDVLQTYL